MYPDGTHGLAVNSAWHHSRDAAPSAMSSPTHETGVPDRLAAVDPIVASDP